jgi:hexosaminidase
MNRYRLLFAATSALVAAGCRSTAPVAPATPAPAPLVQPPRIIPAPESMTVGSGAPFAITKATVIRVDNGSAEALQVAEALGALLRPSTDYPLPASLVAVGAPDVAPGAGNAIHLALASDRGSLGDEGYELTVTAESVRLIAYRPAGLFRGVQTLRQLLPARIESEIGIDRPAWYIPAVTITDHPRFAWRGAMLDVARHFFTVKEVEQFIDIAALYKLNVVHLHLTDDQGWRIAIPSRPLLTSVGSLSQVGGGKGGFYTREDWAEIVRYAQDRYITMVPEIEMPGHSYAAMSAYPAVACANRSPGSSYTGTDVGWSTFCVDSAATYALLDDIIRDLAAMTPGEYIHIGGDEVATLSAPDYVRFIEHVQQIVTSHGKKMIGWEEITKAKLLPTTVAQQWKSDSATAALQYGSKLIMSPSDRVYIDMKYNDSTELGLNWAANIEVRDSYDWDPATYMKGVGESAILGVEAPLWSETLQNITAAEYLIMPRLPAIAEVAWSPQSKRSWDDFRVRLASHAPRWNQLGINWYRSPQVAW